MSPLPGALAAYVACVSQFDGQNYPGSPLIALAALRHQDRLTLIESQPAEHAALREAVKNASRHARERGGTPESITIECADGYERLPAWLPPIERRALVMIDPPYEETAVDFKSAERAAQEALRRLANAVIAIWYPIKQVKDTDAWRSRLISALPQKAGGEAVAGITLELWIHPLDNRVGLNGSGMLLINPPFQFEDRARHWLPALHAALDPQGGGGCAVRYHQTHHDAIRYRKQFGNPRSLWRRRPSDRAQLIARHTRSLRRSHSSIDDVRPVRHRTRKL